MVGELEGVLVMVAGARDRPHIKVPDLRGSRGHRIRHRGACHDEAAIPGSTTNTTTITRTTEGVADVDGLNVGWLKAGVGAAQVMLDDGRRKVVNHSLGRWQGMLTGPNDPGCSDVMHQRVELPPHVLIPEVRVDEGVPAPKEVREGCVVVLNCLHHILNLFAETLVPLRSLGEPLTNSNSSISAVAIFLFFFLPPAEGVLVEGCGASSSSRCSLRGSSCGSTASISTSLSSETGSTSLDLSGRSASVRDLDFS